MKKDRQQVPFFLTWKPAITLSQGQKLLSLQPAEQEECTIRDSLPLTTTAQPQMVLYLVIEQVLLFFIRIPSSTIRLEPFIRHRSLALW